jgi:hypothetical protein
VRCGTEPAGVASGAFLMALRILLIDPKGQ